MYFWMVSALSSTENNENADTDIYRGGDLLLGTTKTLQPDKAPT